MLKFYRIIFWLGVEVTCIIFAFFRFLPDLLNSPPDTISSIVPATVSDTRNGEIR